MDHAGILAQVEAGVVAAAYIDPAQLPAQDAVLGAAPFRQPGQTGDEGRTVLAGGGCADAEIDRILRHGGRGGGAGKGGAQQRADRQGRHSGGNVPDRPGKYTGQFNNWQADE